MIAKTIFSSIASLMVSTVQAQTNYNWRQNGADWGVNFTLCATGKNQSPIDLKDSDVVLSDSLSVRGFEYPNFVTNTLSRGGATNMPSGLKSRFEATFGDNTEQEFYPLQYHLHSPSEHTIDGKLYDLELHIVHVDKNKVPAAVIGFLFQVSNDADAENDALDLILPRNLNSTTEVSEMNLANFLNKVEFREFYNYPGSFTTPPCTEGINWFVVKDVQRISQAQLNSFNRLWAGNATFAGGKGNNRITMPLGTRTLLKTNFDASNAVQRSSKLSAFLSEGNLGNLLTFTSFSFNEIEDVEAASKRRKVLAGVLTPVVFIFVASIVSLILWRQCDAKKKVDQKQLQMASV